MLCCSIVRLLLQFFKENNLHASVAALQEETSVTLNTIENRETFIKDITEGKWAQVLEQIMHLDLAPRKLVDLYEQVETLREMFPCQLRPNDE